MNRADYQVIAVALREAKRELIDRGIIGKEAQEAVAVLSEHVALALKADNPRFNPDLFEREAYPYAEQEGLDFRPAEAHALAMQDELEADDAPPLEPNWFERAVFHAGTGRAISKSLWSPHLADGR